MDTKKKRKFKEMMGPPDPRYSNRFNMSGDPQYGYGGTNNPRSRKESKRLSKVFGVDLRKPKKKRTPKAKRAIKRSLIPAEPRNTVYRVPQG